MDFKQTIRHKIKERYGPVALITGASSGIGKEFAFQLAQEELDLILVARRGDRLSEIKSELESKYPIQVHLIPQDITLPETVDTIMKYIQLRNLDVGVLVNNAGFGSHGNLESLEISRELNMVDLNCRSVVHLTHSMVHDMKQRKKGAIIIISSVLGVLPGPFMATYAATKSFDLAFAKALSGELNPHGIDVLSLLPGYTKTEFFETGAVDRKYSFPMESPTKVVRIALRSVGRKPLVTCGFTNKLGVFSTRLLPWSWLIRISRIFLQAK